jgi:arylsulfatase A
MKTFALVSLLLAVVASLPAKDSPAQPNIIYILADDLGIGDIGCYGQKILKTPRIDELAAGGMRFTNHYSGSASCAPTRSCLMTGQHTGYTRVRSNGNDFLLPQDVTIAEVIRPAGYRSAAIGKWGVGNEGTAGVPWEQGFDSFFGYLDQTDAHFHYPPFLSRNAEKVLYPDNETKKSHYSHDEFTREALQFIRENQDNPFFLYVPYTLAHAELSVPADSMEPWIGNIEETTPYGTPGGQHYCYQERPHATFAGMVSRMDRDIGRIVDLVDELGLTENTLVIFSSDNGPTSAGGADPDFFDGNGIYRGIKFDLYDGGIRCPMIARWPGKIEAGSVSDHLSAHWDVLPTLAELTGAKAPEGIDGISFLPTLFGKKDEQVQHDYLYWETDGGGGWQAVRQGDWKGHLRQLQKGEGKEIFELYDLSSDPSEKENVAAANPEMESRLREILTTARTAPEGVDSLFVAKKKKAKK